MKKLLSATFLVAMFSALIFGQEKNETESVSTTQTEKQDIFRRHSIGSTFAMLGNLLPDPPSFFQLNYGYHLTRKDVIIVEAITWRYKHPLGIPYGPDFDSPDLAYPGKIREYGIGVGYQRFYWKGFYTTVQATPFLQTYLDEQDEKIQNGLQLFLQLRLGYRFEFFKKRCFFEPSMAFNYWPVNTNVPPSFAAAEEGWPNYFLFEPGLHFGFKF